MNFMDLYLLQRANKLKGSLSSGSASGGSPFTVKTNKKADSLPNKPHIVPILLSGQERYTQGANGNTWSSNWSGGPVYSNTLRDETSTEMAFWGAMGNMTPEEYTAQDCGPINSIMPRQEVGGPTILYPKRDRIGYTFSQQIAGGSSSYSPFMNALMFVKNPTASDVTTTVRSIGSSSTDASYNGRGMSIFVPNNIKKTLTTDVTWTNIFQYSASAISNDSGAVSVTFPANKTVAVIFSSSAIYWTSFSNGNHFEQKLVIEDLDVLFSTATGLVPDLDMTTMAQQSRNNSYTRTNPSLLWKECGDFMGDS